MTKLRIKEKMKILHVIDQISQKTGGGASKVAYDMAAAQAKLGHDVTIYSTDYRANRQKAPPGVRLVKFKCWLNLLGSLRVAPGLLFAKYDFDIMHLHNYRTLVNLFASGRFNKSIMQAHGSSMPIRGLTKPIHDLIWGDMLLKRAKRCIADADVEVGHYITEGVSKANIIVIPVGINMGEFRHIPKRHQGKAKTVLFLGRYDRIKGIDLLVEAFKLLDRADTRLEISGIDYGCESEIKALVEDLGLDGAVDYLGPLYGKAKVEAYTRADVFVMPSRYEMWGITFMEALACGTAVIMTDTCEASKLLPPECGMVVSLDAEHLAAAINMSLDINLGDRYRKYRRAWVSQYSWDNIAPQIIRLYEEVLSD